MRRAMSTGGPWVAMVLVVVVLVGCGAGNGAAPAPTEQPTIPSASLAGVGAIVWAAEVDPSTQAPVEPLVALPNDAPQVIAALPVDTLPAGTVLQARWTIDGEPLPALDPAPVTVEEGLAGAWVTWTLRWQDEQPWPIGRLGITVEIEGVDPLRAELPIVRPND